jgi:hypothetical protein
VTAVDHYLIVVILFILAGMTLRILRYLYLRVRAQPAAATPSQVATAPPETEPVPAERR